MKISNIAELKTRRGTTGFNVDVLGYYSAGDGGGGIFYWDNTSTETDNGGTIIKVTGLTTGRWKRIYDDSVSVKWFGAKETNTDNTDFFQKAIDFKGLYTTGDGGVIVIPKGNYIVASTITLRDGTHLIGEGINSTKITYIGSGVLFNAVSTSNHLISKLELFTESSNTTAIQTMGNSNELLDLKIKSGSTGWGTGIDINSDTVDVFSFNQKINKIVFDGIFDYSIKMSHAIDTFISNVISYAKANTTNCIHLLLDTGVSGLYVSDFASGYGRNGLKVQHTITGTGGAAYQTPPVFLFFKSFLADTTTGGDGILFDSSINSTVSVSADFVNCWSSFSGCENNGTVITSSACGIKINGGKNINFQGRVRKNSLHGVSISNSNCNSITIRDSFITGNNISGNAIGSGVAITSNCSNITISSNTISNIGEDITQNYGVYISNVSVSNCIISNNNLDGNVTNGYLNSSSSTFPIVLGNTPNIANRINNGISLVSNSNNTGVQGGSFLVANNSSASLPKINGGLVVFRELAAGRSVVYLVEETSGAVKITGHSSFVAGVGTAGEIGLNANSSETKVYNKTGSDILIAYNILGTQMTII